MNAINSINNSLKFYKFNNVFEFQQAKFINNIYLNSPNDKRGLCFSYHCLWVNYLGLDYHKPGKNLANFFSEQLTNESHTPYLKMWDKYSIFIFELFTGKQININILNQIKEICYLSGFSEDLCNDSLIKFINNIYVQNNLPFKPCPFDTEKKNLYWTTLLIILAQGAQKKYHFLKYKHSMIFSCRDKGLKDLSQALLNNNFSVFIASIIIETINFSHLIGVYFNKSKQKCHLFDPNIGMYEKEYSFVKENEFMEILKHIVNVYCSFFKFDQVRNLKTQTSVFEIINANV
ncbi:MAG: hypothetical protein K2X39_05545 [Silvanigrellaceae bacterium]|nr:hypothetical protein [Silvanigrellaceae bacterium]